MSDALASLRQALAPKPGMRRIPLPLATYRHPSLPLNSKCLINLYAEQEPSDSRSNVALLAPASLTIQDTVGSGPILAMATDLDAWMYVVSGTHLFRVTGSWTPGGTPGPTVITDLGSIGVPSFTDRWDYVDIVTVAVGPTAVVVCVPPNAYTCNHTDPAVNLIGGTWPGNATSVAYLDGYFVFTSTSGGSSFFTSELLDPTMFDALDFAFTDNGGGDVRVMEVNRELWFGGTKGWEVWYDAGTVDFPFRPRTGAIIPHGIAGPNSCAVGDGSLFWLGVDGIIYRSQGYQAVRISDHAIENRIEIMDSAGTSAFVFVHDGHVFYALTMPNTTFVYDCATGLWHERSSSLDGSAPWRVNAAPSPMHEAGIVGDGLSGSIFRMDNASASDEPGTNVLHQMTFPPLWGGTDRLFCSRLEVEMDTGDATSSQSVSLQWSDDGGRTWTVPRTLSAGALGAYRQRVVTTRLGSFRSRVFRLTMNGRSTIYGVDADLSPGVA